MTINQVFLQADAYLTCMSHALSTEKEEIMGLLLGHVDHHIDSPVEVSGSPHGQSFVESVVILQRSVRQADRVEISPLQLSAAADEAEKLSVQYGKPIRVLGWYHSHPHITVQPSHVDVHTQANYQAMDPDFVGLIFSVFQREDSNKFANVALTCFQATKVDGTLISRDIVLNISSPKATKGHRLTVLAEISSMLIKEEREQAKNCFSRDLVSKVHNMAVFTQSMCQLLECSEMPCISVILAYEQYLSSNLCRLRLVKQSLESSRHE